MLLIEDKVFRFVVSKANFRGYAQSTMIGFKCHYTGKTFQQMCEENPEEDYEAIDEHVMYEKYTKPYEQSLQKPWQEITEEHWWDMLECLPPRRWRDLEPGINCFAISEAYTGCLHDHFIKANKNGNIRYYSALRNIFDSDETIATNFKNQILNNGQLHT